MHHSLAAVVSLLPLSLLLCLASVLAPATAGGQDPASDPTGPTEWPSPASVAAHEEEVLEWRRARDERLRQPESWLSLAGLHWLRPGSNTLGSDPANDIVLPDSAPSFVGEIVYDDARERAVFRPAGASMAKGETAERILVDGEPAPPEAVLASDAAGDPTTVVAGETVSYLIERRGELALRVKDRRSPARLEFEGIDAYPVSWEWRITGDYVPYDEPKELQIPSVLGGSDPAPVPGAVVFEKDGEVHRIEALPGGDANEVFLVFGDETNADTTYGGGRFLYATVQASDLSQRAPVVLDFNKAYNPPCVFTPWATCPLPPPSNRLELRVEAGEKMYGSKH